MYAVRDNNEGGLLKLRSCFIPKGAVNHCIVLYSIAHVRHWIVMNFINCIVSWFISDPLLIMTHTLTPTLPYQRMTHFDSFERFHVLLPPWRNTNTLYTFCERACPRANTAIYEQMCTYQTLQNFIKYARAQKKKHHTHAQTELM